jgi:hypothetical protein
MPIGSGLAAQIGLADEVYTNEVQQISGTPSGAFSLIYDGAQTPVGGLAVGATAPAVQAALEALPNIGTGGVVCAGGALPAAITITFSGPLVEKRNVPALTVQTGITGLTVAVNTSGTGFGDYVVPTQFNEFVSSKPELQMDRIKSVSLRPGNTVQRIDRKATNKKGAALAVLMEVPTKGASKWIKGIFGQAPVITTPANGVLTRRHRNTFGDTRNVSQTIQTGVPSVLGDAANVKPITTLGAKVETATFKCELDGYLTLELKYDAKDETDAQTLAAASYATGFEGFHYLEAVVQIAGANVDVTKFQLDVKNNMAMARRFLSATPLKKQQILNAMRELTGSVTIEFDGLTHYDRFRSATLAGALVPIIVTFTGPQIEAVTPTYFQQLVFTMPQCDIVGTTPTVEGPDLVVVDVPFEINWDGTVEPLTLDIFTTDTTA